MENKTIKKCSLNEIFKYSRKMIARAAIPSNEEDFLNSIIDLYEKRVQRKAETDKNRNEYEFQLDLKYGFRGRVLSIVEDSGVPCDANDVYARLNDPTKTLSQIKGALEQLVSHGYLKTAIREYYAVYKVKRTVYFLPEWEEKLRNEVQL